MASTPGLALDTKGMDAFVYMCVWMTNFLRDIRERAEWARRKREKTVSWELARESLVSLAIKKIV